MTEKLTPELLWEVQKIFEAETGAHLAFGGIIFDDDYCRGDSKSGIPLTAHLVNVLNRVLAGDLEPAYTFDHHNPKQKPLTLERVTP